MPESKPRGRMEHAGPVDGAYSPIVVEWGAVSTTPGAVTTTSRRKLPSDWRLSRVDLSTISSAGGASRPTLQITDGTNNLLSGALSAVSNGVATADATTSPSLVAAQRERVKNDILQIQVTTVAAEAVVGLSVTLHGYTRGHPYARPSDSTGVDND